MPKTLIVVILDESGSMDTKKSDTIGGFNSFIDDQKTIKNDQAKFYLIKFNTSVSVVHKGINIDDVPHMTAQTYMPGGGTALYDAIAEGVIVADKEKTEEERVVCVIMTDGEENSSRETTLAQVKDIITGHEARGDWTFLYIGENPDKWSADVGMMPAQALSYNLADRGLNMERVRGGVRAFRMQPQQQARGVNLFKDTN